MGFRRGPSIPLENLVLALDAGVTRSYPGSGTKWYDISPSQISFSSYGTQTPFTSVGGVQCMDFNGSGYWASDSGHEKVDCGGEMTLLFWMYAQDITERDTIFQKNGTSYQSYEQEIAVTLETNEGFSWYSRYATYGYGSTDAMTLNAWNLMGIKMSSGYTASARTGHWSKNGSAWSANYTERSTNSILPASTIVVGNGYAGPVESGYLASLYVYEKQLTDAEVLQFYNATKKRFGHS